MKELGEDNISPSFFMHQATYSETAKRLGIKNEPDSPEVLDNIQATAAFMESFWWLIKDITSWYRCPELNAAVGGAPSSDHMKGTGVDFIPADGYTPRQVMEILRDMRLFPVRQVIIYDASPHVHVGFRRTGDTRKVTYLRKKANGRYERVM